MRLVVLFREKREYSRATNNWIEEYKRSSGRPGDVEVFDPDTPAGASLARTYGIVDYPAVLVTMNDGSLMKGYSGMPLPTISEIKGYMLM